MPLVGAHLLLVAHTQQQAQATVDDLAGQIVRRAELAIDDGTRVLADLSIAGISGCSEADYERMRRAVYANYSLKDVGITDADGNLSCNHFGDKITVEAISTRVPSRSQSIFMQVVELGETKQHGLMLQWAVALQPRLAAVIASEVVALDIMPAQFRADSLAFVSLYDGGLIGTLPADQNATDSFRFTRDLVSANIRSDLYPIKVKLFIPYATFWQANEHLQVYTVSGGGLVGAIILVVLISALRRPDGEASELQAAIERGEFIPYYQPVVDIQNNHLLGCEVLMRRRLPDGTIVSPGAFISLAEATGLALPMTRTLMEQVRVDLDAPFSERPHLTLSINLFDEHFDSLRVVKDIEEIFGPSRIDYRQITLEITERRPLRDIDRARAVIRRLQQLGARVALDDAGAGHGGLAYLQQLGMDVLKIDKLFVDTIGTGRAAAPILDSLLKLGNDLQMEVVAEGVETFEQVAYLRAHGVSAAQGFLFAPPLPKRAFLAMIEAMDTTRPQTVPASRPAVA